jgi:hypothetical protein
VPERALPRVKTGALLREPERTTGTAKEFAVISGSVIVDFGNTIFSTYPDFFNKTFRRSLCRFFASSRRSRFENRMVVVLMQGLINL